MIYFSRRNEYIVEYSGHEEVSRALRDRIILVINKYVDHNRTSYGDDLPWSIEPDDFLYEVRKEFPNNNPQFIVNEGAFHEVFTVVEILLKLSNHIYRTRSNQLFVELFQAFQLSGSVYKITNEGTIEMKIDKDTAVKIDSVREILSPYSDFSNRFFQAVGNLVSRRSKAEDVVKDIFVAVEGYFKIVTGETGYGDAVKSLFRKNMINKEQKKVLDALHEFRSDADGAGHAGNSDTPNEESAMWFLETMISQLRMVDKKIKKYEPIQ